MSDAHTGDGSRRNVFGFAAVVLGIIGLFFVFVVPITFVGSTISAVGIVLGIVGIVSARRTGTSATIPVVGLVLSAIPFVGFIVRGVMFGLNG
jgi:hypothetical protein